MRISDWSSDVCSSDLDGVVDAVEKAIETYRGLRTDGERFLSTYRRVGMEPFKEPNYGCSSALPRASARRGTGGKARRVPRPGTRRLGAVRGRGRSESGRPSSRDGVWTEEEISVGAG